MTKIDFYILPKASASQMQRINFACMLAEKAYRKNHRILLAVDDVTDAKIIDTALWEFKPESFLPHQLLQPLQGSTKTPIEITFNDECNDHHDVLINLASKLPNHFSRFKRLAEIVTQDTDVLTHTRNNYSFYQQRGYPIDHHRL